MTELVVAVYESTSAANMAISDLEVARVPSTVIRREVRDRAFIPADRMVAVTVDDRHVSAVTGILNLQGPVKLAETRLS
jgi:hypothetical protein